MKGITSRSNPWFKAMRQDVRQAGRGRGEGGVWLEGVHLCQEYLQRVGAPVWAVFDARRLEKGGGADGAARGSGDAEAGPDAALQGLLQAVPPDRVVAVPPDMLEQLGDVAGAQGVGFWVNHPGVRHPAALDGDWVLLDRLQDPGNVGSILRTCAAAGITQVGLLAGSAAAWAPKVLRAAQGAHFALKIVEHLEPDWVADHLRVPLCVTTLEGGSDLYSQDLHGPRAWLLGHEGQGVAPHWLGRADQRVFIPQEPGVESLNVAAAAAVCLFEQRRQRRVVTVR